MLSLNSRKFLFHFFIIAGAILMLYPVFWMISSSFKPTELIFKEAGLWPKDFTLAHYVKGWAGVARTTFTTFYLNTFIMVGLAIIGNLISCTLVGYAFARLEFRFKKTLFACMLLTLMIPHHVIVIPQYIIFNELEWIDTLLPIVVPKFFAVDAFFIFLIVQFIRALPRDLDEAARVDGCGPFQTFWRIILPLTQPALVTVTLFTFMWTWNDFFSQLLYLNSAKNFTVTLALRMFIDAEGESGLGSLFAMSTLSIIPIFLVFVFFQKYLVEGIATSGLK
ncbi:carbohydrate ABC transporter permease [Bacillus sp. FJAT-50079]|uniref:carbohydrate ABC transporter permease n=1 Tax=Bacillus sp. FJAT-50079 TaxID=2833577 RepID=UPI001BC96CB3|nr:carbohydrate ABC transporter permease [Bacillus sp. FJAT-50079]MBS4208151.1 carbohydrate ABC transporter permease [Bacillus sp. FJAT-50079]